MPELTFDPTITSGAVLNALVLLVGFVVAFTRIGGRIDLLAQKLASTEDVLGQRLKAVEEVLKAQSDNDKRISVLEERVTNHGKMIATNQNVIEDLRHGRGFVKGHRGIDGEYVG